MIPKRGIKISLFHKIIFSFFILVAVIGSMAAILAYEHSNIRKIEQESHDIRIVRQNINSAHQHITELATSGESVMSWNAADYIHYHEKRMTIDSLLVELKQCCAVFIKPEHKTVQAR